MPRSSSGILLYRFTGSEAVSVEVLVVHPGGPIWAKKDAGAWSIPKGEYGPEDNPIDCARREFQEELGTTAPEGPLSALGEVTQAGGKRVVAWALQGQLDASSISSNSFEMEWPPRSGQRQSFPEVDRAEWVDPQEAKRKLNPAQVAFVERLLEQLSELTT